MNAWQIVEQADDVAAVAPQNSPTVISLQITFPRDVAQQLDLQSMAKNLQFFLEDVIKDDLEADNIDVSGIEIKTEATT